MQKGGNGDDFLMVASGVLSIPLAGMPIASDDQLGGGIAARTLSDFLIGPENHLALTAFEDFLSESPCSAGLLLLYGPSGSGKSRLAQELMERWRSARPKEKIVRITAADLLHAVGGQEYHEQTGERQMIAAPVGAHREAALLVVEDLQGFERHPTLQAELIRTLDALGDRGAAVIVTSRGLPKEIAGLLPALEGRLSAGLLVPLSLPCLETRVVVLERVAQTRGIRIESDATRALAQSLEISVPELVGTLLSLHASVRTAHGLMQLIELAHVREFLQQASPAHVPTLRGISARTARYFTLKVSELRSASRARGVVTARDVAMYLARQLTEHSLEQIGKYFGGRDHTTVLHGCRKTEGLLRTDPATRRAVTELREMIVME